MNNRTHRKSAPMRPAGPNLSGSTFPWTPPSRGAKQRDEGEVFGDLETLCASNGYIHALSYLIFRDNFIFFGEEIRVEDYAKIYDPNRLIRTEVSVLIGLWLKGERSLGYPGSDQVQEMIDSSDRLLNELHAAILAPAHADFMNALEARTSNPDVESPLGKAASMREAIFYAAESAFPYQYLELAKHRYKRDVEWVEKEKGFNIEEAAQFFHDLINWLSESAPEKMLKMRASDVSKLSVLPLLTFNPADFPNFSSLDPTKIDKIIDEFAVTPTSKNSTYADLSSHNDASVFPLVRLGDGRIAFFLEYIACESVYSSPAYWMRQDKAYRAVAAAHRGNFAETTTMHFLERAFPAGRVLKNVVFRKGKGHIAGEVDLLLIHGRRAFLFQIKSKGLTEVARSGDDQGLSTDFRLAVQNAYDQAVSCVRYAKKGYRCEIDGERLPDTLFDRVDEYYPICVTSENYPSLSFQVAQFLELQKFRELQNPIVFDVFTVDVITEFLRTQLFLVDYLVKRSALYGRVMASHELNILGMHLRNNLHLEDDVGLMMVQDDFVLNLDMALGVRRRGLPGKDTPDGILTRDLNNPLGKILREADASDRPEVHRLGELLLSLSSTAWKDGNKWIARAIREAQKDGQQHDATMPLTEAGIGLTVHCSHNNIEEATSRLAGHCELRKYIHRADQWYGIAFDPKTEDVSVALGRVGKWKFDPTLDAEAKTLKVKSARQWVDAGGRRAGKPGRNSPCPCGSGKKYKKCCLN